MGSFISVTYPAVVNKGAGYADSNGHYNTLWMNLLIPILKVRTQVPNGQVA